MKVEALPVVILPVGGWREGGRTGRALLDYNLEPHLNLHLQHPSSRLEPLHGYTANLPAHPTENYNIEILPPQQPLFRSNLKYNSNSIL